MPFVAGAVFLASPPLPSTRLPMISDPTSFLERVVQEAIHRSDAADALSDDADPEALLVDLLSRRLADLFDADEATHHGVSTSHEALLASHEELAERDAALSAALGACECWGEDPDCSVCDGDGRPGWTLPDRRLFAWFVAPAVRRLRSRAAPSPKRPASPRSRRRYG